VTIVDQSLDLVDVVNECASVNDACLSVHIYGESNKQSVLYFMGTVCQSG